VIVESSPICNAMRRDDPAVMPSRRGRIVNGPVVVKSEPEFAFELPDQMLTIGQHFRTTVASDHFRFDEDAVVARKKRKKGHQVGQIPDDPEGMPSWWGGIPRRLSTQVNYPTSSGSNSSHRPHAIYGVQFSYWRWSSLTMSVLATPQKHFLGSWTKWLKVRSRD